MSGEGNDSGGKKNLPLFEFGKGRPAPTRTPAKGITPVPRTPARGSAPIAAPRTPARGVEPLASPFTPPAEPPAMSPRTPFAGVPPVSAPARTPAYGMEPVRSPYSGGAEPAVPAQVAPRHPLGGAIATWLQTLMRAVRGRRLYPPGHLILRGYVDQAHQGLQKIIASVSPLSFRVREDRLFFEDDAVLVDADRLEGLPFLLFSHSIQQIEFKRGIDLEELQQLIDLVAQDYRGDDHVGEDLVTALWRIHLAHFDYLVVDIHNLNAVERPEHVGPSAMLMDDQTRRIRAQLKGIVGALQVSLPAAEPNSSAREGRNDAYLADVDVADSDDEDYSWQIAQMRTQAGLEGIERDAQWELRDKDSHDALLSRLTELLLRALRAEEQEIEGTPGWLLLLALLDAIVRGRQFEEALRVTERLMNHLSAQPRPEDRALAARLLEHLGAPQTVQVVLQVLETTADPQVTKAGLAFIKRLGDHAYLSLLAHVSDMQQPQARRAVVELLCELAVEDRGEMLMALRGARGEVVREVLAIGEALPVPIASGMVWLGCEHLEGPVRARAVALLRGFSGREAEHMVARFMEDREPAVRMEAYRAASHRKSQVVLDALLRALKSRQLDDLEPGELQVLLTSVVAVGEEKVTPLLARLLSESNTLGISRHGADVRVAAARALGSLNTEQARAALESGAKTLNRRVKQACKAALDAKSPAALHLNLPARFGELLPRPVELSLPAMAPAAVGHAEPSPHRSVGAHQALAGIPAAKPAPSPPPSRATGGGIQVLPSQPVAPEAAPAPQPPVPPAPVAAAETEAPPPMLDAAALRALSDITAPDLPAPTLSSSDRGPFELQARRLQYGPSVLEAETVPGDRHKDVAGQPAEVAAPARPSNLAALTDDLALDGPAPAPSAPPRLPSSAIFALPDDEEEGS